MSSLLSAQDDRDIRDAIRLVTDTFADTTLTYYIGLDSMDRWQEDRRNKEFKSIDIKALKTDKGTKIEEELLGASDTANITLMFNLEYLEGLQLIRPDFTAKFDATKDFFVMKSEVYKVTSVSYDGPLSRKDVLVMVQGRKFETSNQLNNSVPILDGSSIE